MKLLRQNCRQRIGLGEGGELEFLLPGTDDDLKTDDENKNKKTNSIPSARTNAK